MGLCCSMNPEDYKSQCSQQNCEYYKQFHIGHCFYRCSNQLCLKYKRFHNGFCKFQKSKNENETQNNLQIDQQKQQQMIEFEEELNLKQEAQKQQPACNNKQCQKFNQNHGESNCQVICFNGACAYFKKYHEIGRCLYLQNGYYYKIMARLSQSDKSSKSNSSLLIPQYQKTQLRKAQRNNAISNNYNNATQQIKLNKNNQKKNSQKEQLNTSIERDNSCIISMPELEINFPKIMSYKQQSYKNPVSYNHFLNGEQSQF